MCHCLACQQRTGSVFGVQARFKREHVTLAGETSTFVRTGDSGGRSTFHFCPTCGSTVWWAFDAAPELIAVAYGAFADPGLPPPTVSVYEERQHPWTVMPALDVEHIH
jgi:hypothetical protein